MGQWVGKGCLILALALNASRPWASLFFSLGLCPHLKGKGAAGEDLSPFSCGILGF